MKCLSLSLYIYRKKTRRKYINLRCLLMVVFISSFIFSSIHFGISKFPTVSTYYLCHKKILFVRKKEDISSGYVYWRGKHHSSCYHSVFSVWFLLGRELVKPYTFGFLQWVGSINLMFAIFTWTAWGRPVNYSMSWFLYRQTVECLENVLWKANPHGSQLKGYILPCDASREVERGRYLLGTSFSLLVKCLWPYTYVSV